MFSRRHPCYRPAGRAAQEARVLSNRKRFAPDRVRSFRIAKLDPNVKTIELELA